MTFRVGMKVVCVDAGATSSGCDPQLVLNAIYTVARIEDYWDGTGLDLIEHPAAEFEYHHRAYCAERFRPVVERKTDISILTALLVPGAKIREDA